VAVSLAFSAGNSLATIAGAWLVGRWVGPGLALTRVKEVLTLAVLGAMLPAVLSATWGQAAVSLAFDQPFPPGWLAWWVGDVMSILVVAPVLLTWSGRAAFQRGFLDRWTWMEITVLYGCLGFLGVVAFRSTGGFPYAPLYLIFPLLLWSTLRFGPQGASLVMCLLALLALGYTARGFGPFAVEDSESGLATDLALQGFLSVHALTWLVLAAVLAERRGAEEELRESRHLLERAQELAHIGTWTWDPGTNRVTWSDEMFRIGGLHPEDFDGTLDAAIRNIHPEDQPLIRARITDALAGKSVPTEYRIVRPDGSQRHVWAEAMLVQDNAGQVVHLYGVTQDMTERKQAEAALRRAHEELLERQVFEKELIQAELDRVHAELVRSARLVALGRVTASIAHDLRNALGTIGNVAYLFKSRGLAQDGRWSDYVNILQQEMSACDRIISNLLETARAKEPIKERLNLAELVETAIRQTSLPPTITCHYQGPSLPLHVSADPTQLRQVLKNLLANAVDAVDGSGEIHVDVATVGDYAEVIVKDSGLGVSAEHRSSLFEPLFSTKARGTGLGLWISRQMVERHGGSLELIEVEGRGAAFRIRLPHNSKSDPVPPDLGTHDGTDKNPAGR
jgi:PAS domain S-box-containing protein